MDAKNNFIKEVMAGLFRLPQADFDLVRNVLTMKLQGYNMDFSNELPAVVDEGVREKLLQMFFIAKKVQGCSQNTLDAYQNVFRYFFELINKSPLDVTTSDIRYFLAVRETRDGVSKKTLALNLQALRSLYIFLQEEEIIQKNPAAKIEPVKYTRKKEVAFTDKELEAMRQTVKTPRNKFIVEGLLSTGCRASEFCSIKKDDVKGNTALVLGKGNKERLVYFNDRALQALENYLKTRTDTYPYLLIGEHKNSTKKAITGRTLGFIVHQIGIDASVEAYPHKFRRTFATNALKNGMSIEKVSLLLGHANVQVTQQYLDIKDYELEEAHKKFVL